MFKKLKNKIQEELEKEQTSTNVSICSSMSSSRADLTQEDQNLANQKQALDSLSALVINNEMEEEEDCEEIVQKFAQPIRTTSNRKNSTTLNDENIKQKKEHEQVLDDLLDRVERSLINSQSNGKLQSANRSSVQTSLIPRKSTLLTNGLVNSNSDQIDKLNEELKAKDNELEEMQERYRKLEQELKDQISTNKKLETSNADLQNAKHEANIRNNKLFNKLDEMKKQSKLLQDKLTNTKEAHRSLNDKLEEKRQIIESLKESLTFEKEEKTLLKQEIDQLKGNNRIQNESDQNEKLVDELKERIEKYEEQIVEKNKIIKLQNQRIHDIKKSVQKGDLFLRDETINVNSNNHKSHAQSNNANLENDSPNGSYTRLDQQLVDTSRSSNETVITGKLNNNKDYATHVNDINFKYLQNVILKFITTTDYESQKHLVKAISTLLKFSKEEEKIIKQSLETRSSWFKI